MAKKKEKEEKKAIPVNKLNKPAAEEEAPKQSKSAPKKEKRKREKSNGFFGKVSAFVRDERTRKVTGLLLIGFSLFLVASFISFFFTWQADQSEVDGGIAVAEPQVKNAMGLLGAKLSHIFIRRWFGFPAFLLLPAIFLLGVRLLYNRKMVRLNRWIAILFFLVIWSSSLLGFAAHHVMGGILGGEFGMNMSVLLQGWVGGLGTGLILLFSFGIFLVVAFNANLRFGWFRRKKAVLPTGDLVTDESGEDEKTHIYTHKDEIDPEEEEIPMDELPDLELKELETEETEEVENPFHDDPGQDVSLPLDEHEVEFETGPEEEPEPPAFTQTKEEEIALIIDSEVDAKQVTQPVAEAEDGIVDNNTANEALKKYGEYDPTLDLPKYVIPSLDLLVEHGSGTDEVRMSRDELESNKNRIVETLKNYGIDIARIKATIGPTVTLYEIVPAAGVRISKIKNLEDDIALSLAALGIRIIAPIPGKGTIGIEVPNQNPEVVSMRSILASEKFQQTKADLPIALGKTISNEFYVADLAKMPHLLVAGATGQGKSVGLNAILISLLYKKHPAHIKFVLVDPKKVELTLYNYIEKHFLAKLPGEDEAIITDTKKVVSTLNSLCIEMDNRYELLKNAQVRQLKEYNAKFQSRRLNPMDGHRFLPYIVVVIDEFADFIMTAGKEVEMPIARIAQLARAVGIHLIIATQRPSVNIITGSIKANFPARVAFRVSAKVDSRTILDTGGADQLIGRGDMLLSTGSDLIRLQCPFIDTPEVEAIARFIGKQQGYAAPMLLPEYVGEEGDPDKTKLDMSDKDDLFEEAARIVVHHQQGSASLLQRRLNLGYNRAGRLIDQLESAGIVGPNKGSKAREVLVSDLVSLEQYLNNLS